MMLNEWIEKLQTKEKDMWKVERPMKSVFIYVYKKEERRIELFISLTSIVCNRRKKSVQISAKRNLNDSDGE